MNIEEFSKKWIEYGQPEKKFVLYIDIPFCLRECAFCIFSPNIIDRNTEIQEYLEQKLLRELDVFNNVLENRIPDVIYFGGGTPSLLSIKQLESIILRIPHFDKIKVKSFECHPLFLNKEKMSYLLGRGFHYYSMGIQTFDRNVLNAIHRDYVSPSHLRRIVEMIRCNDSIVSVDLIAFLRKWNCSELEFTKEDLRLLTNEVKPNIIVLHSNYKLYQNTSNELNGLKHLVKETLLLTDYYSTTPEIFDDSFDASILESYSYNLYNGDKNKIFEMKQYDCSGPGNLNPNQDVLGLGGYGKRRIYSYIGNKHQWYIEISKEDVAPKVFEVPYNTLLEAK